MVRDVHDSAVPPFSGAPEPERFHLGPSQEEALARLDWLVGEGQRCGLVVAEAGMGKSHLVATAARRLGGLAAEVTVLSLAGLAEGEWLELLLDRIPLDTASRAEPLGAWLKLENRLRENTLLGRPTVLFFDDIDRGPSDAQEGVARLATAAEPRFGTTLVVATARPAGLTAVPEAIRRRAVVRIELPAWSEDAVAAFLAAGLARVGRPADVFAPAAVATIQRFAAGVPDVIGKLAHLALAAADAEGLERIDAAMIEEVWRELAPDSFTAEVPARSGERQRFRPVRRLWG